MQIALDQNEKDRQAVYALRYKVMTQEGGDERYADHVRKIYRDQDDGTSSRLVIAWTDDGNHAVGAIRLTALRDTEVIAQNCYAIDTLAKIHSTSPEDLRPKIMRMDRAVVDPAFRGQGVLKKLHEVADKFALQKNCIVYVAAYAIQNISARQVYLKIGWTEYAEPQEYQAFVAQPIYKTVRSLK